MDVKRAMPPAAAERLCDRAAVLVDHGRGGGDAAPDSRARTGGDVLRRQHPEHARSHARDRAGFAGALGPSCKIERASRVASCVC